MDFLNDRYGAVRIDGVTCDFCEYRYGLPQGSCLSPILFNIYMSDMLPRDFSSTTREAGVFADDIRVSCFAFSGARASALLTANLRPILQFSRLWRIRFDTESDKCGTMTFAFILPKGCSSSFKRIARKKYETHKKSRRVDKGHTGCLPRAREGRERENLKISCIFQG